MQAYVHWLQRNWRSWSLAIFFIIHSSLLFYRFAQGFPSIAAAYDRELFNLALDTDKELGMEDFMQTGVYFYLIGPSFNTAAETESRMMHALDGDSIGMSTAPEV